MRRSGVRSSSSPPLFNAQPLSVGRFHFQTPHGTRGSRAFCVCQGVIGTGARGGWFDPFLPSVLWKSQPCRLLGELEHALRPVWMSEICDQGARTITHKQGDLLWRDTVGWAVCLEEVQDRSGQSIKVRLKGVERAVMSGYYVNVSEFCSRNSALSSLVADLRRCVAAR